MLRQMTFYWFKAIEFGEVMQLNGNYAIQGYPRHHFR